jgi:hypothetical protein
MRKYLQKIQIKIVDIYKKIQHLQITAIGHWFIHGHHPFRTLRLPLFIESVCDLFRIHQHTIAQGEVSTSLGAFFQHLLCSSFQVSL